MTNTSTSARTLCCTAHSFRCLLLSLSVDSCAAANSITGFGSRFLVMGPDGRGLAPLAEVACAYDRWKDGASSTCETYDSHLLQESPRSSVDPPTDPNQHDPTQPNPTRPDPTDRSAHFRTGSPIVAAKPPIPTPTPAGKPPALGKASAIGPHLVSARRAAASWGLGSTRLARADQNRRRVEAIRASSYPRHPASRRRR